MQIFVIKLRIFLTRSQIDSSLFDSAAWWRSSACWQKYVDTKRLLYIWRWRGFYELDLVACQMNMSFNKAAGSNSEKTSWNTFSFMHLLLIFHEISLKKPSKIGFLVMFGLHHPECCCHSRNIKSGFTQFHLDSAFHHKFGWLVEF